jgi:hypothetical protein
MKCNLTYLSLMRLWRTCYWQNKFHLILAKIKTTLPTFKNLYLQNISLEATNRFYYTKQPQRLLRQWLLLLGYKDPVKGILRGDE